MYRIQLLVLIIFCFFVTSAKAIRDDSSSGLLQMDTNMTELMSLPQPDSSLRFLQTLTNQQQDIQNLNLNLQKNEQESKVKITRLEHRIDFISMLLWCFTILNALLLLSLMFMALKIRSLSKKIKQPVVESIETSEPISTTSIERKKPEMQTSFQLNTSSKAEDEEKELEELLSSVKEDDIAALFSDNPDQNFFQQFQNEIDRERSQFKQPKTKSSNEDEDLDKLLDEKFSEIDFSKTPDINQSGKIKF